jgi:SAM-dependent methyltransferase
MLNQSVPWSQDQRASLPKVLFLSNQPRRCGVYEFGKSTIEAIQNSTEFRYVCRELSENTSSETFFQLVDSDRPSAIIFNWHPATMPWLSDSILEEVSRRHRSIRFLSLVHDEPAPFHWIDLHLYIDPNHLSKAREFTVGRRIQQFNQPVTDTVDYPIIGSYGFGLEGKGFHRVVEQVNKEFDQAKIRLHIPISDYCDPKGETRDRIENYCRSIAKPGIQLEITSDYKSNNELLQWLAGNTINCFFYDEFPNRGISSVIDYALAARRPIAIQNSTMFRHISKAEPTILIEHSSLRRIIQNGLDPLHPFLAKWNDETLVKNYDQAVHQALQTPVVDLSSNRVLTVRDRVRLRHSIQELHQLCPDIMSRKLPDAVFQNAFIFEQVRKIAKPNNRIILIGGYEDPIGPALESLGWDVTITDPCLDDRSLIDVVADSYCSNKRYDIVVSCSVLEHVEDDLAFLQGIYSIMAPGGTALLTTDFRHDWVPNVPKPTPDVRLYSLDRLAFLVKSMPESVWLDSPSWQAVEPYFFFDGSEYCFCSISLRNDNSEASAEFAARLLACERKTLKSENNHGSKSSDVTDFEWTQNDVRQLEQVVQSSINCPDSGGKSEPVPTPQLQSSVRKRMSIVLKNQQRRIKREATRLYNQILK